MLIKEVSPKHAGCVVCGQQRCPDGWVARLPVKVHVAVCAFKDSLLRVRVGGGGARWGEGGGGSKEHAVGSICLLRGAV
jgi:hypothetical protein